MKKFGLLLILFTVNQMFASDNRKRKTEINACHAIETRSKKRLRLALEKNVVAEQVNPEVEGNLGVNIEQISVPSHRCLEVKDESTTGLDERVNEIQKELVFNVRACKLQRIKELMGELTSMTKKVSFTDEKGNTLLHLAACCRDVEIMRFLIDAFQAEAKDINSVNSRGDTPLHRAAAARFFSRGSIEVVRFLVEEVGVDVSMINCNGKTARELASEKRRYAYLGLLEEEVCRSESYQAAIRDILDNPPFRYVMK